MKEFGNQVHHEESHPRGEGRQYTSQGLRHQIRRSDTIRREKVERRGAETDGGLQHPEHRQSAFPPREQLLPVIEFALFLAQE